MQEKGKLALMETLKLNVFADLLLTSTLKRFLNTIPKNTTLNRHNLEWTLFRTGTIPNGHYPK